MKFLWQKHSQDWELFVRYVVGECSEREIEQVRSAIAADPDKARLLDELQRVWERSRRQKISVDKTADWGRLNQRIREDARIRLHPAAFRPPVIVPDSRQRLSRFLSARVLAAIATAVLGFVSATALLLSRSERVPQPSTHEEQEVVTLIGQRATIRLPDGTIVYLNAASRFRAPDQFDADRREVHLEGEAFFEVAQDSARPFIVHTSQASVEVLGTAFDVSVYPDERQARVVVAEGSVSVRRAGAEVTEAVVLNARDLGVISEAAPPIVHNNVDLDRYLGWREGRLVFQNAPFQEVAAQLERKYGIEVELVGSPGIADGLTATFKEESLSEIVRSIATTLRLQYTWSRERITFSAHNAGM